MSGLCFDCLLLGFVDIVVLSGIVVFGFMFNLCDVWLGVVFVVLCGICQYGIDFVVDVVVCGVVVVIVDVLVLQDVLVFGVLVVWVDGLVEYVGEIVVCFYCYLLQELCVVGVIGINGKIFIV